MLLSTIWYGVIDMEDMDQFGVRQTRVSEYDKYSLKRADIDNKEGR